jgi:hypothetical protein
MSHAGSLLVMATRLVTAAQVPLLRPMAASDPTSELMP